MSSPNYRYWFVLLFFASTFAFLKATVSTCYVNHITREVYVAEEGGAGFIGWEVVGTEVTMWKRFQEYKEQGYSETNFPFKLEAYGLGTILLGILLVLLVGWWMNRQSL